MGTTPRTFQSKTGRWLVAVLMVNASTLAVVGTVTVLALSGRWRWVPALSLFVGAACEVWMLRSTRYILEDQHIRVLCGPFRRLIPIRQIRSVTSPRRALAGPALSLDRLRIDSAGRLISDLSACERRVLGRALGATRGIRRRLFN